ncbi:uncharacterized protein LOC129975585 [Argiope bruennichi]|uniref:uncharacterized protein LOC129975585 n=1 Tax=Argiope bruennichi TaxID=94029 RepID=UPI002493DCC4|nr:uncharacterized protein LOC129975585 [Argiope bruennichi]
MPGPLFLKEDKKSWVLIFTCAVYTAVHFEIVTAASTDVFLMAFRRFVSRRGRCTTIYCDNGSNFVGAANYLKQLDWNRIQKYGTINSIDWKFNPPTAACDSMSVLQQLGNTENAMNPILFNIIDTISSLKARGFNILFCWIHNHVSILGNEKAHTAARTASVALDHLVPQAHILNFVKKYIIAK